MSDEAYCKAKTRLLTDAWKLSGRINLGKPDLVWVYSGLSLTYRTHICDVAMLQRDAATDAK
jgi:hypothetical protein